MLSQESLKALMGSEETYKRSVLSVYLDVDQSKPRNRNREFEATLAGLLRPLAAQLAGNAAELELFQNDACRMSSFVKTYRPDAKTLVLFSGQADLFWVRSLHVPIREAAVWQRGPFLRPLIEALDEHGNCVIALADRGRARLFLGQLGELEEFADVFEPEGRHRETTGNDHWRSQVKFQRHANEHTLSHVHQIVRALLEADQKMHFDRLVLGGSVVVRGQIELALPKRLRRKLVASVQLPVDIPQQQLFEAVQGIDQEVERREELGTVERLFTSAIKGQEAVIGLNGTLEAAAQGQIHKLIYADNFVSDRAGCLNCGTTQQGTESCCEHCGGELQPAERLLDQIVDRVERTGGKIEAVKDKAAQLMNEDDGGIGAFLRF